MKTYQITIGGENFPIRSDAAKEHVESLATEVQNRFNALNNKKGPKGSQNFRVMSMVAIVLLAELRELEEKSTKTNDRSVEFAKQMTERIDRILMDGFKHL